MPKIDILLDPAGPQSPRNHRQRHVRRMLGIVHQSLMRDEKVVSRSLLPPVFKLRSYFGKSADERSRADDGPGANTRDVNHRSMSYFSTLPGVSGTSLSISLTKPRPRDAILYTLGMSVGKDVEQHDVPVGVFGVGRRPQRGRHLAGHLDGLRERIGGEHQRVASRSIERSEIFVERCLELARIDEVGRGIRRVVGERVGGRAPRRESCRATVAAARVRARPPDDR